jgi:hypothetical protein
VIRQWWCRPTRGGRARVLEISHIADLVAGPTRASQRHGRLDESGTERPRAGGVVSVRLCVCEVGNRGFGARVSVSDELVAPLPAESLFCVDPPRGYVVTDPQGLRSAIGAQMISVRRRQRTALLMCPDLAKRMLRSAARRVWGQDRVPQPRQRSASLVRCRVPQPRQRSASLVRLLGGCSSGCRSTPAMSVRPLIYGQPRHPRLCGQLHRQRCLVELPHADRGAASRNAPRSNTALMVSGGIHAGADVAKWLQPRAVPIGGAVMARVPLASSRWMRGRRCWLGADRLNLTERFRGQGLPAVLWSPATASLAGYGRANRECERCIARYA